MSDNDDVQVGRVLTRREVLILFGAAGTAATLAACAPDASTAPSGAASAAGSASATNAAAASAGASAAASGPPSAGASTAIPACIVRPEQTEGPYFVDEMLERADITTDPAGAEARPGVPLAITFAVSRIDGTSCVPLEGALVDIWHCDADGVYSDVQGEGAGHQWLRGYQVSDANGTAAFQTIYPGWYQGRTVHIHFKIRTDAGAASGTEFTAQLYFDDAVSDEVYAREPYASNGERSTRNANDGIYGQGGDQLTLAVTGDPDAGYAARFEIGLQTA